MCYWKSTPPCATYPKLPPHRSNRKSHLCHHFPLPPLPFLSSTTSLNSRFRDAEVCRIPWDEASRTSRSTRTGKGIGPAPTSSITRRLHKVLQEEETEEAWEEYKLARNWKKTLIRKMKRKQYRESREKACESQKAMWRAWKASRREGSALGWRRAWAWLEGSRMWRWAGPKARASGEWGGRGTTCAGQTSAVAGCWKHVSSWSQGGGVLTYLGFGTNGTCFPVHRRFDCLLFETFSSSDSKRCWPRSSSFDLYFSSGRETRLCVDLEHSVSVFASSAVVDWSPPYLASWKAVFFLGVPYSVSGVCVCVFIPGSLAISLRHSLAENLLRGLNLSMLDERKSISASESQSSTERVILGERIQQRFFGCS